jgi:hypothetical protein
VQGERPWSVSKIVLFGLFLLVVLGVLASLSE